MFGSYPLGTRPFVATASPPYLGRFRRGDTVPVDFDTVILADSAPSLTLLDPSGATVATYAAPWIEDTDFGFGLKLVGAAGQSALGTLRITIGYSIDGEYMTQSATFDLVDGGDSGGGVISMFVLERPEQSYCVAQLGGSLLVQGRNPHL